MKQPNYDIFVSYRREGGYETALPIVEKLRSAGYRVFFDLETMNPGKFNEQLINVISNCKDFILVLPANGLDRCTNEDDWVRKEITCAIKGGKNIIPVMLRGFEWPAQLPDELSELPLYQGISATAPEHFDLAIERLKGYLKSEPKRPWRRWGAYTATTICAIALLALIGWFAFRQAAKPVAKEAATRLTFATTVIHSIYEINADFDRAWDSFIAVRTKSPAEMRQQLDREFLENIDSYYTRRVHELERDYPDFTPLSSIDRKLLGLYDIDAADIDALQYAVSGQADEALGNFNMCAQLIRMGMLNTASLKSLQQGREADLHGMNEMFYLYLTEISKLPESARGTFRQSVGTWHLFPSVSYDMKPSEYESMAKSEHAKLEKAIIAKESLLEMLENSTNRLEEYLFDLQQSDSIGDALSGPAQTESQAPNDLSSLKAAVEKKRAELAEANRQIKEQFERYKAKFKIEQSDDQYIKWGKVIKAADYLGLTVSGNNRRRAEGLEPIITNRAALEYVNDQLDDYCRFHPETRPYVASAKQFYADVAKGIRQLNGAIMMGTQDNTPHDLLCVGDIMVERNSETVTNPDSYYKSARAKSPGTVKFLRLIDGSLHEISSDYPENQPNIGLLPLADLS